VNGARSDVRMLSRVAPAVSVMRDTRANVARVAAEM
jgi:hypothetical protein